MTSINRRSSYLTLIVLTVLTLLLAACGKDGVKPANTVSEVSPGSAGQQSATDASASPLQPDPIQIKIADILTNPVLRIAKTKGFFDKYAIKAELVTFATPAEGINSLFIKQTDIAWGADFPILNAVSKGDYGIVAATGTNTDAAAAQWKLYVRDGIQQAQDLKGKKLSTLRGTFLPYLWDEYLKANGLAAADSQQIGQGGFDEAYVALKKGEIDASWVVGSAMIAKFADVQGIHELTDMSKTTVRIGGAIIASNDLIQAHPQGVANFLSALDEASQFITAHPEETADILFKEVKQPKEATLRDLPTNNWQIGFKQESFDSLSGQKQYMVKDGIIKNDFDLKSKLSLDSLRKALPDRVTYGQ
ncbi:ABC transporter substrate-binding protein [Paenibacillus athensensis]|uniref:Nitrate ABC transporter substrate-binding protein n=1 Tax=Paenibacillus athensensis TaxID=1967502 RepID=A0A4Y8Q8V3_9BACL|nr:ABC transporter substrate-binding protein [Paenibacillus athensensis]MCD1260020.1 ABC transporter substrate-binding protein [Paenibacillus athensensis]